MRRVYIFAEVVLMFSISIIVASTPTSIETKKAQNKITLHHLLTHTAGYSYSWYSEHIKNWSDINKIDEFSGTRRLMPLIFEPGTRCVQITFSGQAYL